ncbi:MAG: NAD(P)-dependent oxidoreductase [Elainellaceae cyanobacterium]
MNIVITDYIDLLEADWETLRTLGDVTVYEDIPQTESDIIRRIAKAELITVSWIDITAPIIHNSPHLKYIVVPAVGYDQIDLQAAQKRGIRIINCPRHNALAVAEYTIGLMFAVTRHIIAAHRSIQHNSWNPHRYQGVELRGKHLVLIGYGNTGRQVAQLAQGLGMSMDWASSNTSPEQLDQLIASADILSLHLPLTPSTHHLLDARRLTLMKSSAYLINTARGAIVDQQALIKALKQQRIAGAALDVFDNEPITDGPNAQIIELSTLPTVVATPHIAYNTQESTARLGQELIANIKACLQGKPINMVG